jgi:AmiR/NasT family two-component response regulator
MPACSLLDVDIIIDNRCARTGAARPARRRYMPSALKFLIAARRCEIHGLEHLALTCELVSGIGQLVHMLQRERGVSTVFTASQGARFDDQLASRVADSVAVEDSVRAGFERLDTESGQMPGGARLFSRIALVLDGLDALPVLRERVLGLRLSAEEVGDAYCRLIGGLLAVVFEAADSAGDPDVSRALVAMFNFMQGKELAGQERATVAAGFAIGSFDAARQHRLVRLIDGQQRCFDTFMEFADPASLAAWREALPAPDIAELERLRRMAVSGGVRADGSEAWFELATRRIDAMKLLEDRLAVELLRLAECKTAQARSDLEDHSALLESFSCAQGAQSAPVAVFFDTAMPTGLADAGVGEQMDESLNPQLGRSILDLVRAQAQRLQSMGDELARVRTTLHERKVIERAKGVLMTHRGFSEDQAYRMLRQTAMDRGKRLVEVAEAILGFSDILGDDSRGRPD